MDVVDRFQAQARLTPTSIALVHGLQRMRYRELDENANRLAHYLRSLGVGPEVVVGQCLKPGLFAIVGLLAILKAGGVYLPLDPAHPAERLAYLIEAAGARLVLGEPGQAAFSVASVVLAEVRLEDYPAEAPDRPGVAGNLACIMFTSGSTGHPKGIGLCSRSIESVADWALSSELNVRVCAQLCSLGFDMSLQEIFGTLLGGGRLVIVDEQQRKDPYQLTDLLAKESVEQIYLSPSFLRHFAEAHIARSNRPTLSLRQVIAAGEPLRITAAIREFLAESGGTVLQNQYGPSETHQATANVLGGDLAGLPAHPTLGWPISNVRVYVLDKNFIPVPGRQAGEIFIGGASLARGYVGQPALTAERFIADPFAGQPGSIMYRTGDRGRWTADGELEYLGRLDDQVKVRGYRIEPAEVERSIALHPQVNDAAVVPRQESDGTWRLEAYIVAADRSLATIVTDVRRFLAQRLPDYMLPAAIHAIDVMPLNRNGKVDRVALANLALERRVGTPFNPPGSDLESILCAAFADILDVRLVGIDDSFLELGGNSLLATRIVTRIIGEFDVRLPVRMVFDRPTVRELAIEVELAVVAEIQHLSSAELRQAMTPQGEP